MLVAHLILKEVKEEVYRRLIDWDMESQQISTPVAEMWENMLMLQLKLLKEETLKKNTNLVIAFCLRVREAN